MDTVANLKEQSVTQTPLLLFHVTLSEGQVERWSTHEATVGGDLFEARVLRHNLFEVRTASDQGVDAIPKISIMLANADSHFSQVESSVGFKGAKVRVSFLFYDLIQGEPASETLVLFQGVFNPPEEVTESTMRLTAVNRMNMQRVLLPPVRIQRRCPWDFPSDASQRQEAVDGGPEGMHSRFFRCGYSPGEPGGAGDLNGAEPFTDCNFTRSDCLARGMFDRDSQGAITRRFGGLEFVPATIRVRGHGERNLRDSPVVANEARYNDFVPLAYGTVWLEPPVVFARNDGNLTRMEVLLGLGPIQRVLTVVVNNIEIPVGVAGQDMTDSGWWNLFAEGGRNGGFNLNFATPEGEPLGDPYGSMAALSIVVPNQINDGEVLPRVRVLMEGVKVESFNDAGSSLGVEFTKNPAWILLDVLRRSGWLLEEVDLASFASAAAFCDETIAATDNHGNPISVQRFQANLVIRERRTAADVIRGVRHNARLQLTYREHGKLAVHVENSLALQQPTKPEGSNALEQVNGGWPAYAYSDGSDGVPSAILRSEDRSPAIRLWSRPIADTPNRFSNEFADSQNGYQQDSLALVDAEDVARTGQEITGRLVVDGLPTFDQAARILKFFLDKSLKGNRYIDLQTSVKGLGQRPGDIITVTYVKEGLVTQPFRIVGIQPSVNYQTVRVTAQIHDDAWYQDTNGQLSLIGPTSPTPESEPGVPDPLVGGSLDEFGNEAFTVTEFEVAGTDGSILTEVEVAFTPPRVGQSFSAGTPIVSLQPNISTSGGTLEGDQVVYYVVTATDLDGRESNPSFVVRAMIPAGTSTNAVQLTGLSFTASTASFNVYRGDLPTRLHRIASEEPVASTFTDTGAEAELTGAPDPNFDHANFYWRLENTEEQFASTFGPDWVGSSLLEMTPNAFEGHAVRLIRGKGAGQERSTVSNTETTLTVKPAWEIEPDESTVFVVSNNTWHFAGRARTSPARFAIPNRAGEVVQITGRAANAQNIESLERLGIVTRWKIGGGGLGVEDFDVPPAPTFGVSSAVDGTVEFAGLGFSVLENTQSIRSGTFQLYYRDELSGPSSVLLDAAVDDSGTELTLSQAGPAGPGDLIQIGSELLRVTEVQNDGLRYLVERGRCNSPAASHSAGAPVYHLKTQSLVVAFEPQFFGTAAGAAWSHRVALPSVRLACVNLWMTNVFGQGEATSGSLTNLADQGLRTLQGGQFNFQLEGLLAVLDDAAPTVSVQQAFAIRDVFAQVKQAPEGLNIGLQVKQDGVLVAALTIPAGQTFSAAVNGAELPVLNAGADLTLDITAVGTDFPGRDLTVTLRV